MGWQTVAAALLVGACAAYAVWALLPAALRRRAARRLGRPEAASGSGGACGGCDGCGGAAPPAAAPHEAVIRVVKRPPAP
jgi:hypothetical protein